MTRVIHTGDTHIGYQQYHSPVRRQDFLDAFESVIRDAIDDDVDAVVHAGDLFHDRRPDLPDLLGTISALRRLERADVPFLAVVGNHESTRDGQWLDLFERLGLATRLGEEPVVVGNTAFYGLDHVPVSRRDELEYAYEPHDAEYAALVAHGLFEPFAHADWDTETVLTRSTVAFDALLLGDNHKPDRAKVAGTWVTYPGSTERASASEREGRGYNLVTFGGNEAGDEERVDIRRRALETREFVFITVELHEGEGESRARDEVRAHDLTDAVALVEIVGDGETVTPAAIEEVAEDEGALIARVTDRRDIDTESEFDVSFADPEAAVRERIDSMGLSEAARSIDETVRDAAVADSNVRPAVNDRIAELIDDPGAFTPAVDENEAAGDGEVEETAEADQEDGADRQDETEREVETERQDETEREDETDGDLGDRESDHGGEPTPRDQQVSMEDYL